MILKNNLSLKKENSTMKFTKMRALKIARNENQITEKQFEVVSNRYAFYDDSEWDLQVADNSVYIADHYRGENKRF